MSEETKYTTSARIMKICAYLLMGAGLILTMLSVSSLFYPGGLTFMNPWYMLGIGLVLLFMGVPLLAFAQQGLIKPEFKTVSLVRCTNVPDCKYTEGRKFERGDYVFKELDEKCKKCNSQLIIAAIFDVKKTPTGEEDETAEDQEEEKKEAELPKPKDTKNE